jgi:hypothetical protein
MTAKEGWIGRQGEAEVQNAEAAKEVGVEDYTKV